MVSNRTSRDHGDADASRLENPTTSSAARDGDAERPASGMKDKSLLTLIVVSHLALGVILSAVAIYMGVSGGFSGAVKAILALVTTIIIGVAGIGRILAGKRRS